ncbi:flagellar basal-body rod protein FlgB [Solemya pervernicosa gill symbiont]|uniref:Flagellar basal body rod protein FlgB n=2 Tax=Gammaproteobacteria incertae sedis TaxID=118884 RepID=A0A1T2L986_9GAMM|nr:flagellar basal body rod protein FlgB [Candidatus Reidiella endopervernicosa]OOZ41496.1 flagellar basal-body rod protein FlgB [Solemya pervernicosa gill symbiont]QKQ27302.1 flagellar basal body rod protein FlgB [Candidatus Reidiella endopervernicosa]
MPINIDSALGIHSEALRVRARRAELIASNLANADTPNYKARDIDFKAALGQAQDQMLGMQGMNRTHSNHITSASSGGVGMEPAYRVPNQASLDGNTVDVHVEQAEFSENSIQYQASLRFLGDKIKAIRGAIRGE